MVLRSDQLLDAICGLNKEKTNKELTKHYPNNTGARIANQWDPNARQHMRERRHIAANKRVKINTDYGLLPPEPNNDPMLHRPISPTVIEQLHKTTTTSKQHRSPDISRLVAAALEHETAIPDEIPVKATVGKFGLMHPSKQASPTPRASKPVSMGA